MGKRRYRYMSAISVIAAAVLILSVFLCVRETSRRMTRYSFETLTKTTQQLAKDMYSTMETDQTRLQH